MKRGGEDSKGISDMRKGRCGKCDDYERRGHNYCRMCGYHLRKGYVRRVRRALAYHVNEKYCGYCGGPKNNCECTGKKQ